MSKLFPRTVFITGALLVTLSLGFTAGCYGGSGRAQFFVTVEDSIPDGLEPGTGEEEVTDGWTVRYTKFLVALGNVQASRSSAPNEIRSAPSLFVMDLLNLGAGGFVIADFPDLATGQWDRVSFDLAPATAAAQKGGDISQADFDHMVQGGYSLYIEGEITNPSGMSCRPNLPGDCVAAPAVSFRWGLAAATRFADCAVGGQGLQAGFAVPSGGTVQIRPTLHGDHWLFTNITQGAEVTSRRAQWIADSDLDRNGETTLTELRSVQASQVFPPNVYNLSGALLAIQTAYDYFEAQARTMVDYQGDGECPTRTIL